MKKVILFFVLLFSYFQSLPQETFNFSILSEKAKTLSDQGKFQSSNETLYPLLKKKMNHEDEFNLTLQILSNHYINNKMDSSTIYLKTLKELEKRNPSKKKTMEVIYRDGLFFLAENNKKKAITSFFEASRLAKEIENYIGLVKSYTAIGRVLYINKDYSKALEYLEKSIEISQKNDLPNYEGNARTIKGITEIAIGNLEESLKEFQIAENLLTGKMDLLMLQIMKMNYYLEKGDQTKVNSMALSILAEMNTMELSGILGDISKLTKKVQSSSEKGILEHLESIEKKMNKTFFKHDGELEHYVKASMLVAKKDAIKDKEIKELKRLLKIKDSTYLVEKEKAVTELETKYRTKEKELSIEKEKKKKQEYAGIAILTLLSLLFFIYYAINRKKRIEYKNKLALVTTRQETHNEIGIELHDKKAKDLERIAMKLEKSGEAIMASEVTEIKNKIRHLSSELRSITFEESSFIDQLITLGTDYSNDTRKIKLSGLKDIDWSLIPDSIKRNLFLVIREGVSNAATHSKASIINIICEKNPKQIEVSIIDNGAGFDQEKVVSGSGMRNMKMRIKELNGTIEFQSTPQKGTSIYMTIITA